MRLFVGLWPPPEVLEPLVDAQRQLHRRAPRGVLRMTAPEQIHLTFRFLGEVEASRVPTLEPSLRQAAAAAPSLVLHLAGVGAFPDPARARVVWVGLAGDVTALADFHARWNPALDPFAEKPDRQSFHPHLTLARVRDADRAERLALARALEGCQAPVAPPWRITSLKLMRSDLHPDGARYCVVAEFPIDSPGPHTR